MKILIVKGYSPPTYKWTSLVNSKTFCVPDISLLRYTCTDNSTVAIFLYLVDYLKALGYKNCIAFNVIAPELDKRTTHHNVTFQNYR